MPKNINALIVSDNERFVRMLELELAGIGIFGYTGERELLENIPEDISLVLADLDACDGIERRLLEEMSRREHISLLVGWSRAAERRQQMGDEKFVILHRPFHMSLLISLISERLFGVTSVEVAEEIALKKSLAPTERARGEGLSAPVEKRLTADPERKAALWGDEVITLSEYEYRVLELLVSRRGEPVSRERINLAVGSDKGNMGDVYVCHLRKKIDDRLGLKLIYTVRGKGYMLK